MVVMLIRVVLVDLVVELITLSTNRIVDHFSYLNTNPSIKHSSMLHKVIQVVVQVVKTMVQMVRDNNNSGDFILVHDRIVDNNSFLYKVCYWI